jgi:SAM-dependent methyltransferase
MNFEKSPPVHAATNRANPVLEYWEKRLASGEIDEARWYHETTAAIAATYVSADDPRAQSGFHGDDNHWKQARGLITDGIHRSGALLDAGCANGYLMECLAIWAAAKGQKLERYGLDICPELIALARQRLPRWANRFFVGNVIDWEPPQRFDFVRIGLEYVPRRRQRDLVRRLLERVVAPAGRLIIGTCNEEKLLGDDHEHSTARLIQSWGWNIAGSSERPHWSDERLVYRVFWIETGKKTA